MSNQVPIVKYQLRKFDLDKLWPGSVSVLIGKRGSGKSFLMRNIMYAHRNIPRGIVVSGTENVNKFFGDFIPPSYIYTRFDSDKLASILDMQEQEIKQNGKRPSNHMFLILDDVLGEGANIWKDPSIRRIFFDGRHYNLTVFICIQYSLVFPPSFRSNIDFCFIFSEVIHGNKKRLYEHFCGMFETYKEFDNVLKQTTIDRESMVVKMSQNANTSRIEDMVFWYKAVKTPSFRVGCPQFWQHHEQVLTRKKRQEEEQKKNKTIRTIV